jgi:hypothetical protein
MLRAYVKGLLRVAVDRVAIGVFVLVDEKYEHMQQFVCRIEHLFTKE